MSQTGRSVKNFFAKQAFPLISTNVGSKMALPLIDKIIKNMEVENGDPINIGPRRQREDKSYIIVNVLRTALKCYKNGSPGVKAVMKNLFLKEFLGNSESKAYREAFTKKYGRGPTGFIALSPEGRCNLQCKDCYATSVPTGLPKLSAATVNRILDEKYKEWGSWFTVISGGEPFMWKDNDIDIIEIARMHPEQYFLVYTNGTYINEKTAKRLAEIGNMTPAISVEGFEKETDDRRGKGMHKRILTAFENLRNAGVPFGISVTATRENADIVVSDELINYYFKEQGASYQWIFQYMPIGRGIDTNRQVPPLVRKKMWEREQELIRKDRLFLADFWNCGTLSSGCISGGRSGGYLYIDWNGNVYPCAFVPYWKDNINDLYAQGKTLSDALLSDLFVGVRKWQSSYNYKQPPQNRGNEIRPCFIRDHHEIAHNLIVETQAKPGYESAEIAIHDEDYYNDMIKYDKEIEELFDPIWENLYREKGDKPLDKDMKKTDEIKEPTNVTNVMES
jgi:MoaA/NifB/PqqE/SkfB family radical SAM enzyme